MHDELRGSPWDCRVELSASDSLISTATSVGTRCVVGSAEVVRQDNAGLSSPVHPELKLRTEHFALLSRKMLRALIVIRQHFPDHEFDVGKGCKPVGHTDASVVQLDPKDLDTTTKREWLVGIVNRDHSQKSSRHIVHHSSFDHSEEHRHCCPEAAHSPKVSQGGTYSRRTGAPIVGVSHHHHIVG
jgi:hypothetical protein